jgi:hypothetical protein
MAERFHAQFVEQRLCIHQQRKQLPVMIKCADRHRFCAPFLPCKCRFDFRPCRLIRLLLSACARDEGITCLFGCSAPLACDRHESEPPLHSAEGCFTIHSIVIFRDCHFVAKLNICIRKFTKLDDLGGKVEDFTGCSELMDE